MRALLAQARAPARLRTFKLVSVLHRSEHHASASGYTTLARHLSGSRITTDGKSLVPYRLRRLVADQVRERHSTLYDSNSVAKELSALARGVGLLPVLLHYFHAERDFFLSRAWARMLGWKAVGTFHKPPEVLKSILRSRRAFQGLDAAVCVGENQIPLVQELLGHERAWFVPHGVDTDWFVPARDEAVSAASRRCVFVGQHLRDFGLFGTAIRALHQRLPDLKVTVVVSRHHRDRVPVHPCIEVRCGITDAELRRAYQESACMLLPLIDSTACNSVLESLACGTPVVTNDVGGIRGYMNDDCGCIVPGSSPDDVVDGLVEGAYELLTNGELNIAKRAAARATALRFSWPATASMLEELLSSELAIHLSKTR